MNKDIKRGCGKRVTGGVYVVTELSHKGIPINAFLFDPPWVPIDETGERHYPGSVGLHPVENPWKEGVTDLWDWIGESYYPFFPDFWEETMRYGLSRRISGITDFDKLSSESEIIGFHPNGVLTGVKELYTDLECEHEVGTGMDLCPHNKPHDTPEEVFCIRYLWQLVDTIDDDVPRLHEVSMPRRDPNPQFTYDAAYAPFWIGLDRYKAEWIPAAMFHLPIHRLEVIEDPFGGLHELQVERLEKSITDIPFVVVKE